MKRYALLALLLCCAPAFASKKPDVPCSIYYSVVQLDTLGNISQGVSGKNIGWIHDLQEKYPGVCYAPPDPSVKTVLYISIAPATYNGTRIVTTTNSSSGQVNGDVNATYSGTNTSSTAIPYNFEYGK